jgi:hypothetical protein
MDALNLVAWCRPKRACAFSGDAETIAFTHLHFWILDTIKLYFIQINPTTTHIACFYEARFIRRHVLYLFNMKQKKHTRRA